MVGRQPGRCPRYFGPDARHLDTDILPPALLETGGDDLSIFFDRRGLLRAPGDVAAIGVIELRGTAAGWSSVRPFREETDVSGGDLPLDWIGAACAEGSGWRGDAGRRRLASRQPARSARPCSSGTSLRMRRGLPRTPMPQGN